MYSPAIILADRGNPLAGTIDWRTSTLVGDEEPRDKRDSRDDKKEHTTVEMSGAEQPYRPPRTEGAVLKRGYSCCMLLYCCNLWTALSRHGAGMAFKLLIE
jgi:hypothetical protein